MQLFTNQKFTEAVHYIATLGLHQHFNISEFTSKLVHQDKFAEAALLVQDNKEYQIVTNNHQICDKLLEIDKRNDNK